MSYSAITAAEVAEGKPVTSVLLGKFRDNTLACYNYRKKALKTSATSRNTTTTVVADPDLVFTVGANETWFVRYYLLANIPAVEGMDVKVYVSAETETGYFCVYYNYAAAFVRTPAQLATNTEVSLTGAGAPAEVMLSGYIYTGAVGASDSVELQWAQTVSGANNTIMAVGSYLIAHRLDTL